MVDPKFFGAEKPLRFSFPDSPIVVVELALGADGVKILLESAMGRGPMEGRPAVSPGFPLLGAFIHPPKVILVFLTNRLVRALLETGETGET